MSFFHDQVHLYDNNQSTPYKAGHIRLKHSQETESQVPSVLKGCRKEAKKKTNLGIQEATFCVKSSQLSTAGPDMLAQFNQEVVVSSLQPDSWGWTKAFPS